MRGKHLTYIALAIVICLASTAILGTKPASAQGPTVFANAGTGTTPLTVFPRVAYNSYVTVYVKIKGLPHLTNEAGTGPGGTDPTDLLWAYQVSIHWNPAVLSLTAANTYEPGAWTPTATGLAYRSVLKFAHWYYDPDLMEWSVDSSYGTSWGKSVDTAAGTAVIGMTLTAETPEQPWNTYPLPDLTGSPDEGYHEGVYYDLPYDVVNKYDILVRLRFINLDPAGVGGTMWSPIEIVPGPVDTKLKTIGQTDVIPECITSYYGSIPDIPQFPFGLGVVMMIAPAVALMYLWRTHKKQRRV